MKHVFTILLLCVILQSVLTSRRSLRMRMAKVAQAMKLISDAKEKKLRKLENTDESVDSEAESTSTSDSNATVSSTESVTPPDTSVQPNVPPVVYNDTSAADEEENVNATAENAPVNASKPVATKAKTTSKIDAKVQITKFHSFKRPHGRGKVTFGTFFYFFGRPIVPYIVVRLRITYRIGLRNLQEATAESARTDCTIENPSLAGKVLSEDEGANVNYNCEANATQGDASTANFTLNTDVPLTMVNANGNIESLNFEEVNFNGDSAEASSSLQDNTIEIDTNKISYLKNTLASFDKYILILLGDLSPTRLLRRLLISNGDIKMNLSNTEGTTNEYDCYISSGDDGKTQLACDTSSNPLKSTVGDLHLSSGTNGKEETLFIYMKNATDNATYKISPSVGNKYTYSKSSSGLSGGAIAGIVIACVVALAAASIAAIMLRKPSPPVDNTTIVDLKTETI